MSDLKTSEIIITVLLSIAVVIGMGTFLGDLTDAPYYVNTSTGFVDESQDYVDELENNTENLQDNAENFNWGNPVDYIVSGASVVTTLLSSGSIVSNFIGSLPTMFSLGGIVPSWVMSIVIIIIILIVVFELVSAYLKYKL